MGLEYFRKVYVLREKLEEWKHEFSQKWVKRLSLVEKAKECECFGILVCNAEKGLRMYEQCKQLLEAKGKRYFSFLMSRAGIRLLL